MFCNQCGKEIPNEALFCPGCGAKREVMPEAAPVEPVAPAQETPVMAQPVAPEQPVQAQPAAPAQPVVGAVPPAAPAKKSGGFPFKIMIPVAIVFVLLVVILVVVLAMGKGSKYDTYTEKELMFNYDENVFYVFGDEDTTFEIEEDYMDSVYYSADYSSAVYLSYEESSDEGKMLYYIDNKDLEAKLIAEDVYACKISYTGEYVAYVQDVKDYSEGDLYLYNVKSGDITQIDSDVYPYTLVLSPNGKIVSYLKDYENYDDNTLYLGGINKDSVEIDDDGCTPISVTDNGKYLYYVNASSKLYLYNGKESEKIASDISYDYCVNKDATEILYEKDGKTYYHTVKADDAVKVMSDYLYDVIVPENTIYFSNGAYMVGLETFKGAIIQGEYEIYWFNTKGTDSETICYYDYDSSYAGLLSEDGKSFVYVSSGNLYKIDKLSEDMEETLLFSDVYVEGLAASDDLSKIYVAGDDELYYIKSADKAVEITNDLSEYEYGGYSLAYNEEMGKIFFIEDDTLCYAGTNEKSVEEVEDDVYSVFEANGGVVFVVEEDDYEYTYYFMNSKEPVELELY